MAQSYVGKRPTSKGIGRGIQRFMIGAFAPRPLASAARVFRARRTVADRRGYAPRVAIVVSSKPPALNELPSLLRNALISSPETRAALRQLSPSSPRAGTGKEND
jgi:hypothetical protein